MEFQQVIELIKVVSNSALTEFVYEEGNQKIHMQTGHVEIVSTADESRGALAEQSARKAGSDSVGESRRSGHLDDAQEAADAAAKKGGTLIKSPLVGRFYTAPTEDAEPFVRPGDVVKKGQTLAIVEAMKLMNEIESEYDGVVEEVLAQNGQSVEYGQPLFRLKEDGGLL